MSAPSTTGRRVGRITAAALAASLAVAACGDDSGGGSTVSSTDTTTSSDAGGSEGGAVPEGAVVIEQVAADAGSPFAAATIVGLGDTLAMDPFIVTVSSIDAGEPGQVEAAVEIENTSDAANAGPDVYGACLDPENVGLLDESKSTYVSLQTVDAGASTSGVAVVDLPPDCAEPFVQVRVLPLEVGGDRIAGLPVPAEAIG